MSVQILHGDCRDILKTLSSESIHCCVSSPPYWGLRDYGVSGQIGLEPTYQQFVAEMVRVFREVRRVLRADGTLWLNLGDSYASGASGEMRSTGLQGGTATQENFRLASGHRGRREAGDNKNPNASLPIEGPNRANQLGLKPKNLCGIPWRVAFALQEDGWYLRQDLIWAKPNPMPESVTDRCTKAHEYLFLLSKNARYYFDGESIKEDSSSCDPRRPYAPGQVDDRGNGHDRGGGKPRAAGNKSHKYVSEYEASETEEHRTKAGLMNVADVPWTRRNKRSVWEVATAPFSEAHFATFPPALIEPCIKAACPKGGTVLDPFGGSGTTGLVADRLQRDAILIELNSKYAEMAKRRIHNDAPLFAEG